MDEEANYILRKAGYDLKPWEGFVQRGSTYGGISKAISHDKLKGIVSSRSRLTSFRTLSNTKKNHYQLYQSMI